MILLYPEEQHEQVPTFERVSLHEIESADAETLFEIVSETFKSPLDPEMSSILLGLAYVAGVRIDRPDFPNSPMLNESFRGMVESAARNVVRISELYSDYENEAHQEWYQTLFQRINRVLSEASPLRDD